MNLNLSRCKNGFGKVDLLVFRGFFTIGMLGTYFRTGEIE